jgi:hypothetical protein
VIGLKFALITSYILGDPACIMVLFNISMLYHLLYKKKQQKIDQILVKVDRTLDNVLRKLPYVGKKMISEEKKKL